MVTICGVVILLALIWIGLVQPLFVNSAALETRVLDKQAQLANLQELAAQVRPADASSGATAPASGESIVVIIDRTTRSRELAQYLKRNQPDGTNGVRLRFEGAPFDTLIAWLGELKNSYGMWITTANFDESDTGRVNCSLVIMRGG
jgi:type II secretory pathway component PulM